MARQFRFNKEAASGIPVLNSLLAKRKIRQLEKLYGLEYRNQQKSASANQTDSEHVSHTDIWQVVSPGRSGTRWLTDLLLAVSPVGIVHAPPPQLSLAKVGFLFDRSSVGKHFVEDSYFQSREGIIDACRTLGLPLVDLDCKNSPLVPVLAKAYPNMRFIVMLRSPKSFVLSGLTRGYFRKMIPLEWGHLAPLEYEFYATKFEGNSIENQANLIAYFWNRIALLAQQLMQLHPERTTVFVPRKIFSSRSHTVQVLSAAELPFSSQLLMAYPKFFEKKNTNSTRIRPESDRVDWKEVHAISSKGLSIEFQLTLGLFET